MVALRDERSRDKEMNGREKERKRDEGEFKGSEGDGESSGKQTPQSITSQFGRSMSA